MPTQDVRINPVHWVKRMVQMIPAQPQEPFFLVREKDQRYPLTSAQVRRLLHEWSEAAGIDAKRLMPHCLRCSGLNLAHEANVTGESLRILGDWAGDTYMRYLDVDFRSRVKTGRKIVQYIHGNF